MSKRQADPSYLAQTDPEESIKSALYSFGDASTINNQSWIFRISRKREKDVVVDQVIYAKAVKVLENPAQKDLEDFIVWRMDSFHIAMTFLGVIGKTLKDADLKDLLVESVLFVM